MGGRSVMWLGGRGCGGVKEEWYKLRMSDVAYTTQLYWW